MNLLITGGAGYIGSHFVHESLKRGDTCVVLDDLSTGYENFIPADVLVRGNCGNVDLVSQLLEDFKVETVVHFAGSAYVAESVKDPAKYYANNIVNSIGLLEAMRCTQTKKIIFSSSCTVYGIPQVLPITEATPTQPINPYGSSKLFVENMLRSYDYAYGIKSLSLRYFNAAGNATWGLHGELHRPEPHVIPRLFYTALGLYPVFEVLGNNVPTPDGTCIRDYIHVLDLVQAHQLALDYLKIHNTSDFFNLGTGSGISVLQLIKGVEAVTGRKVPFRLEAGRLGDPPILVANAQKAASLLGFKPVHSSLENILQTAWDWFTRAASQNLLIAHP